MAEKHGADSALWKLLQELEKLRVVLRRYARNPADCEDLVQRTRELLLSNPARIPIREPERYILRTARNVGIDYLRKQRRERIVPLDQAPENDLVDERLTPADEIALEQARQTLRSIMMKLPPRRREVFRLSREEGLEQQEIARRLDIKLSTVKNHLTEAMMFVAAELERREKAEHEGVVEKDT